MTAQQPEYCQVYSWQLSNQNTVPCSHDTLVPGHPSTRSGVPRVTVTRLSRYDRPLLGVLHPCALFHIASISSMVAELLSLEQVDSTRCPSLCRSGQNGTLGSR